MRPTIENIAEAVAANDRTGMKRDAIAQHGAWIKDHARMQHALRTQVATVSNHDAGVKHAACSHTGSRAHGDVRADTYAVINVRAGRNHCRRVPLSAAVNRWGEERRRTGKIQLGFFGEDDAVAGERGIARRDDAGGGQVLPGNGVLFPRFQENQR